MGPVNGSYSTVAEDRQTNALGPFNVLAGPSAVGRTQSSARAQNDPLRPLVLRSANIPALRSELHASPQSFDRCLANGPLMAELRLFHTAQQNRDEVNPATEKAA